MLVFPTQQVLWCPCVRAQHSLRRTRAMHKTTRLCTVLLRASTCPLKSSSSFLATSLLKSAPQLIKCRHYANKAPLPKEAIAFLETLREQYKPHEDKISMEQAEVNMNNWSKEGKLERALRCFNKVIDVELPEGYARTVEMREHTANAYIGRAYVYVQTEKHEEALADYQYLLDNFDDNPEVLANTATLRFQTGDCENALPDINKCLEGPLRKTEFGQANLHAAYRLRAHIYADLNMMTEALADANYLLDKKKNIENYMFRSNLYHEFGNVEEAKKDLDVADEMGADDAPFWFSRSLVCIYHPPSLSLPSPSPFSLSFTPTKDVQVPGGEAEATKSLKKAFRRDPSLEREIDDFPALKPIFENILKSRGASYPPVTPSPPDS